MSGPGVAFRPARPGPAVFAALVLAGVVFAGHLGHLDEVGLTWDEPPYLESVSRIQGWAVGLVTGPDRGSHLREDRIREVWGWDAYHNPHPPFYKEVMAVTEAAADGWLGRVGGARLSSLLWFALLVGAICWVASGAWGLWAGVAAGLAAAFMPRLAGHGHIAATDMPVTCLFFLACVGFALLLRSGRRGWGLVGAVAFGLAMGTKFTGYLVPLPLVAWALTHRIPGRRVAIGVGLAAAALALAVATNPLAWHDPAGYLAGLFRESLSRDQTIPISTMYWGEAYGFVLPWHHALVMTGITVPLGTLLLGAWGALGGAGHWREEPLVGLSLAVTAFFWLLLALPSSPNHDGVRLFLPMFPFVALLAGRGFEDLRRRIPGLLSHAGSAFGDRAALGRTPALATLALAVLFLAPAAAQTAATGPYYLSYYNEVIGGLRGAAERGMERTYWYDALTPRFLRSVNRTLPAGTRLATFPEEDHFLWLQDYGLLRDDVEITGVLPAPYFLQYARTALFDSLHWGLDRKVTPVLSVEVDGVALASLYRWSDGGGAGETDGTVDVVGGADGTAEEGGQPPAGECGGPRERRGERGSRRVGGIALATLPCILPGPPAPGRPARPCHRPEAEDTTRVLTETCYVSHSLVTRRLTTDRPLHGSDGASLPTRERP